MHASVLSQADRANDGHQIDDATVWQASDFPDDRRYVLALDAQMAAEIVAQARRGLADGLTPDTVTSENFALPLCAAVLARAYTQVEHAPGFSLVSGFPVTQLKEPELRLAYAGFCSYFGNITIQNRDREQVLEVTDKGKSYSLQSRGYHSTVHLDFHNDGTNTVALLCTQTAAAGGVSQLLSGPAVYNQIARERPDLLAPLLRGFHHHRRDQLDPGDAPVTPYRTPVFSFTDDLFHMAYAGPSIMYCEEEGIVINDHEKEALGFFTEVCARAHLHVAMELRQGDIQLVNNYLVLHSRTAYRDSPEQVRRLLRLWLDDPRSARLGPGKMDWYLPALSRFTRMGLVAGLEHQSTGETANDQR